MLIAARDKCNDDIDVIRLLEEEGNEEVTEGKIVTFYGESLFHRSGQIENDGLTKHVTYVDSGDNPPHKMDEELNLRVKETMQNGMSEEETNRLQQLLRKYRSTFLIIFWQWRFGKSQTD